MKRILLFLSVFLSANLFGQNVYISDTNFKAYLVGNSEINTNGDAEIQISEASVFDGEIDVYGQDISDLTGIEAFTSLTRLNCNLNNLTSIDVSQNTALKYLNCGKNPLTSLDVSNNADLEELYCRWNPLTSLDVSNNIALTHLVCIYNLLTSLDVSQNTALTYLNCSANPFTTLDVSQNTALTHLQCEVNSLTSLDVSQNTALIYLLCYFNQLTTLDVSQNTALLYLWCEYNQLTCLNMANGNNINFTLFRATENPNLNCVQVDDAEWSSANWTDFNGQIDPQMYFSEDCNNDCTANITELSTSKNLIQIFDLMGRETSFKPNTPLIYVYDDGSIEKVFSVEY